MQENIEQMMHGFKTAFINQDSISNLAYKPQLVSNNYKEGRKVISSIEDELLHCDSFFISVAFITLSGLTPLLQTLKELECRGIPGQILTTDYLNFSEPKALEKLAELKNIRIKMYCTEKTREGFHTKGYIFRNEGIYRIIVGSSNITLGALTKNREWNTRIISTDQGEYANEIIDEFHCFWESEYAKDYDEFIEHYTKNYDILKRQRRIAKREVVSQMTQYILQPNKMQIEFVNSVKKLRQNGEKKGRVSLAADAHNNSCCGSWHAPCTH